MNNLLLLYHFVFLGMFYSALADDIPVMTAPIIAGPGGGSGLVSSRTVDTTLTVAGTSNFGPPAVVAASPIQAAPIMSAPLAPPLVSAPMVSSRPLIGGWGGWNSLGLGNLGGWNGLGGWGAGLAGSWWPTSFGSSFWTGW